MVDPARRLLRQHLRNHKISIAEAARRLGRSRSWLGKILNGQRSLDVEVVDAILRAAEIPLESFWADYLAAVERPRPLAAVLDHQNPIVLLQAIRQGRNPRSETLEILLPMEFSRPLAEQQYEIDRRAGEIDDLRESSPAHAAAEAEHWVRNLLLRHQRKGLERQETAVLATSLGVWGSALRVCGQNHLAARALEIAINLHGEATSSPTYADLLERSAFVLKAFGYIELSLGWIQRSMAIFAMVGNGERCMRSVFAHGVVHFYLGRQDLAIQAFEAVLKGRDTDPIRRAGAAVNLAVIYERGNKLYQAEQTLGLLAKTQDSLPTNWFIQVQTARARILVGRGAPEKGADLLRQCVSLARQGSTPERAILVFFDFAWALLQLGAVRELMAEARSLSELLTGLEETPASQKVAAIFMQTILSGSVLEAEQIEATRSHFLSALKHDRADSWPNR